MRKVLVAAGWGWAAAIIWLSLTPSPPRVDIASGDKLGHLGLVGTMTVLLNLTLKRRKAGPLMLGSMIVLTAMILEEGSQYFIPARSFDGFDSLANLVGVLCGEGLVRMLPRRVTSQDRQPVPPLAKAPASCGAP